MHADLDTLVTALYVRVDDEIGTRGIGRPPCRAIPSSCAWKRVRQLIESVDDTLKGRHDLEQHGRRTFEGVAVRVAQRILAVAAAIRHNDHTGAPVTRSLIAYDH
ncbi:hypothetical protein EF903_24010 [Streptomyces sp. WAC05292]|uniref:hypothetical protein n=1 Tax=Streptomyces sp. WAC05292 TaxID=2487418 RepID=UPI000F740E9A|nr:hypothetical protein EF903_24010 [Streptomyces sp. WAC05292]